MSGGIHAVRAAIIRLRGRSTILGLLPVYALLQAVNLVPNLVNLRVIGLPFFMDSIGTAIAAAVFGPLFGVVVGLTMNLIQEVFFGFSGISWPFGLCGAATGAVVGTMAKRGRFAGLGDVMTASVLVTFANSVLGAIIATFLFGGLSGVVIDYVVSSFVMAGQSMLQAAFWARVPVNLVDKTVAVLAAYLVVAWLEARPLTRIVPPGTGAR